MQIPPSGGSASQSRATKTAATFAGSAGSAHNHSSARRRQDSVFPPCGASPARRHVPSTHASLDPVRPDGSGLSSGHHTIASAHWRADRAGDPGGATWPSRRRSSGDDGASGGRLRASRLVRDPATRAVRDLRAIRRAVRDRPARHRLRAGGVRGAPTDDHRCGGDVGRPPRYGRRDDHRARRSARHGDRATRRGKCPEDTCGARGEPGFGPRLAWRSDARGGRRAARRGGSTAGSVHDPRQRRRDPALDHAGRRHRRGVRRRRSRGHGGPSGRRVRAGDARDRRGSSDRRAARLDGGEVRRVRRMEPRDAVRSRHHRHGTAPCRSAS